MRAGRYPDQHPLELRARAQLRQLSPEALEAVDRQPVAQQHQATATPVRRTGQQRAPKRRWG